MFGHMEPIPFDLDPTPTQVLKLNVPTDMPPTHCSKDNISRAGSRNSTAGSAVAVSIAVTEASRAWT